jgi:hypothetical protein
MFEKRSRVHSTTWKKPSQNWRKERGLRLNGVSNGERVEREWRLVVWQLNEFALCKAELLDGGTRFGVACVRKRCAWGGFFECGPKVRGKMRMEIEQLSEPGGAGLCPDGQVDNGLRAGGKEKRCAQAG